MIAKRSPVFFLRARKTRPKAPCPQRGCRLDTGGRQAGCGGLQAGHGGLLLGQAYN